MAVCLRIYIDHNKTSDQLYKISDMIFNDQKLFNLLQILEKYESTIGTSPIGAYKKWNKEFESINDFNDLQDNEGAVTISNNVFTLHIAKNAVVISHWTKLGYFCDDIKLQKNFFDIINVLYTLFNSTTVIYAADSTYRSEMIASLIYDGGNFKTVLKTIDLKNIRIAENIKDIKKMTSNRHYETDACFIENL